MPLSPALGGAGPWTEKPRVCRTSRFKFFTESATLARKDKKVLRQWIASAVERPTDEREPTSPLSFWTLGELLNLIDNEVDHRTDIFALGAILWFILTQSKSGELPVASAKLPRHLRAICEKAMAADPDARYQDAAELTADLAHYLNGAPVSAYSESLLERAGRIYARHSTAFALVLVYLVMRLLFIFLARR